MTKLNVQDVNLKKSYCKKFMMSNVTNSITSVFCTPEDENQSWQVLGEAFQL